jgi:predicted ATPase/DNA-binding SARP family transcriptional activator
MEVLLLGPLELRDGERRVRLPGPKQRALLALLAVNVPNAVPDERILDELWGEDLPRQPINALQQRVTELRRLGGGALVIRRGSGYALGVAADDVDSSAFERDVAEARRAMAESDWATASDRLETALLRWRGRCLDGIGDVGFARAHSTRLEELRLAAIEDRAECELALGRHAALASELAGVVAEHPHRERLRGQLMLALYRAGRQTDALASYESARRQLRDDLGLEPGAALRALENAILRQDPALDGPAVVTRGRAPATPASRPSRHRPPVSVTHFIGRAAEQERLGVLLTEHRLVTVTGPGGAGKTRLAIEVAGRVEDDDVWFVELAPVAPGPAVAETIADAVGASELVQRDAVVPPVERVVGHVLDSPALLVLDNCEHVLADAADLVATLLAGCSRLRVLATTREPLGIPGEIQMPLGPLEAHDAAELFVTRARASRPDFDAATAADVVHDVCGRLDRMPLAIELAAARVKALPLEHIARRLDDRFRLLTTGSRTALPRHQTLRATVEWSYDMLFDAERVVFTSVSVFAGSFDLDAATAVCATAGLDEFEVLDIIGRLVDKSLLNTRGSRYTMLETLRQFGCEQLEANGSAASVRAAHAEHLATMLAAANRRIHSRDQIDALDWVSDEHDNVRAAAAWALDHDPEIAIRIAGDVAGAWWLRGHRHEARTLLDAALEAAPAPTTHRAAALRWAAQLANAVAWSDNPGQAERELAQARARAVEALEVAEAAGDRAELGQCHRQYAVALWRSSAYGAVGDPYDEARHHLLRAKELAREAGDEWGVAFADVVDFYASLAAGPPGRAEELCRRILPAVRALGERFALDRLLIAQALLAEIRGDTTTAAQIHREGIALCEEFGFEEGMRDHAAHLTALGRSRTMPVGADGWHTTPDELAVVAASRRIAGTAAERAGDLDAAAAFHQEALERYQRVGMASGAASSLLSLAGIARARGDVDLADDLERQAGDLAAASGVIDLIGLRERVRGPSTAT